MSTASDLEGSEDLEHVTLVRMEDVQPDKSTDLYVDDEMIENLEYDNECIIDDGDEDYAIGSMVPIKWGGVVDIDGDSQEDKSESTDCASDTQEKKLESAEDSNDTSEYIIPEMTSSDIITKDIIRETSNKSPSSWPTLEILPGGVIKDADKYDSLNSDKNRVKNNEMVYACAKCPQKYKRLYCLVRHVKWHEDQEKKLKGVNVATSRSLLKPIKIDVVQLKKEKGVIQKVYKLKCDKSTKIQKRTYTFPNRTKHKTNLS